MAHTKHDWTQSTYVREATVMWLHRTVLGKEQTTRNAREAVQAVQSATTTPSSPLPLLSPWPS